MSNDEPMVRTLPGARWGCTACGHCCRSFDLGPIEPGTLAVLKAADPASFWPAAAQRPWFELRSLPVGGQHAFLSRVGGACIFLAEDQRCAIHAQLGEAAKPAFCREFPFHLTREREDYSAVLRPTCAGLHASRVEGEPIHQRAQALPALERAYPLARFDAERVEILPGLGLDLEGWYRSEPAILALLDAPHEPPEASVAALREALARATGRSLPAPDPTRYRESLDLLLRALTLALEPLAAARSDDPRDAVIAQALGWIERARVVQRAPLATDARAWLNEILRSLVFGKLFHRQGGLPRAMGKLLLDSHLARTSAAPPDGAAVDAARASAVLAPWWNLSAHGAVVQVLRQAAPQLETLFLNASNP